MKIRKILIYTEVVLLISIILTPIVYFSTPWSIEFRQPRLDYEEGDIIKLTIDEFSFDYNLSYLNNFNVTAGIYLNPIFTFEEGLTYVPENLSLALSTIKLYEGNLSSKLHFNFQITSMNKDKTFADVRLVESSENFSIGRFGCSAAVPFLDPFLRIGLTFSSDDGVTKTTYVHWRYILLFSTKNSREALNWQSRNVYFDPYEFAKEDRDTFTMIDYSQEFFTLTRYKLQEQSNRLHVVNSTFEGVEKLTDFLIPFTSNVSSFLGIPDISYWSYQLNLGLKYHRGGREL